MNLPPRRSTGKMQAPFNDQHPSAPDAGLAAIERRLSADARRQPVPAGLVERVFDASVGLLPRRRLRLAGGRPEPVVVPWWRRAGGRLALAASIGLAFLVAVRIMPSGGSTLSPDVELVLLQYAGSSERDLVIDPDEPEQYGVAEYLSMTREMTFRDLAGDLALVAADLGM